MIAELQLELARIRQKPVASEPVMTGRVVSCDGGSVEVAGLPLPVGSLGAIEGQGGEESLAEVIGFRAGHSLMMLLGDTVLLQPDASVRGCGDLGHTSQDRDVLRVVGKLIVPH